MLETKLTSDKAIGYCNSPIAFFRGSAQYPFSKESSGLTKVFERKSLKVLRAIM
jgi:hypothetical protein